MEKSNGEQILFALCLNNDDYRASLEVGKFYQVISDAEAEKHGYLRVIDESGEDCAYTRNRFHFVTLPLPVEQALLSAIRA